MKKLTLGLLLCVITASCGYKKADEVLLHKEKIEEEKPEFHLKVKSYSNEGEYYCIVFTNDNWLTHEEINDSFNLKSIDENGLQYVFNVCHQIDLFKTKEEAILLSKQLSNYELCIIYNQKIKRRYDKLLKIFKSQPIKEEKKFVPEKDTIIY